MKDFKYWGIKYKEYPELNYKSIWYNLNTIRLGSEPSKPLGPLQSEFYDISLGTKCNMNGSGCWFCYTGASQSGRNYSNICKKAIDFFGSLPSEDLPFQVACGSGGEPTIHPEFCEFLETIYNLGIVPNYTTNGLTLYHDNELADKILEYTEKYCAGVAISANSFTEPIWRRAVERLGDLDVYTNLHLILSDQASVNRFFRIYKEYKDQIHTIVLLPLMPLGRSQEAMEPEAFDYLVSRWSEIDDPGKVAFGAHFYNYLKDQDIIKVYKYPPESFSKNLILDDTIKITPSSFDTSTILWQKEYKP